MTPLPSPAGLDPLFVWMAAAALAVLFAHAAVTKLADAALFEQHLAAYGVRGAGLLPLSRALPLLELATAVLLLTPWRAFGAAAAAALLLLYAAAMAWHLAHGRELDCGCGGEPLPLSWALVARNALLAALAGIAGASATALPRALGLADFLVIAAAIVLGTLLWAALHQMLRHPSRAALARRAERAARAAVPSFSSDRSPPPAFSASSSTPPSPRS